MASERTLYQMVRSLYSKGLMEIRYWTETRAGAARQYSNKRHYSSPRNLATISIPYVRTNQVLLYTGCLGVSMLALKEVVQASQLAEEKKPQQKIDKNTETRIIREADVLYSQSQVDKLYEFLQGYDNIESAKISWRQARAACDKAKHCDAKSEQRKELMIEGFKYAEKSIDLDDQCGPCHRWYALMLNYVGDYEGTKQKIKYSYIVQQHFQQAVKLDPTDATSMYCLGQWCYFFADMSWYTQKIAALIFGTPPTSTFQEALEYFSKAEQTDPNFYSMNHVMLAKTYIKLNDKVKAKGHLIKARELPIKTPDDKEAHAESIELLGKLQS